MTNRFIWVDVVASIGSRFERCYGWDQERAKQVAEVAADQLRKDFGGAKHYIPSGSALFMGRIKREFNGRNITELSKKYGVSCRTVRRYVNGK